MKNKESNIIPFSEIGRRQTTIEGPFYSNDQTIAGKLAHLGQQFQMASYDQDREAMDAILADAEKLKNGNL